MENASSDDEIPEKRKSKFEKLREKIPEEILKSWEK